MVSDFTCCSKRTVTALFEQSISKIVFPSSPRSIPSATLAANHTLTVVPTRFAKLRLHSNPAYPSSYYCYELLHDCIHPATRFSTNTTLKTTNRIDAEETREYQGTPMPLKHLPLLLPRQAPHLKILDAIARLARQHNLDAPLPFDAYPAANPSC